MESEPPNSDYYIQFYFLLISTPGIILLVAVLILLLVCSALVSGSEVAYFSLGPNNVKDLKEEKTIKSNLILSLKEKPQELLATILIANNFINIAIVILTDYLLRNIFRIGTFDKWASYLEFNYGFFTVDTFVHIISFLITILLVTFLLVLFGEVTPKIYANVNKLGFAKTMSRPLTILSKVLSPLSLIMVSSTKIIEDRLGRKQSSQAETKEELDKAIELTVSQEDSTDEEADILKGIIKFNDVAVKQIMKSRVDVQVLDIGSDYDTIIKTVKESGYSRLPVIDEDFDNILGILYIKDLIDHSDESSDYNWQQHIRHNILYVPEAKKINDLLKLFQQKRMHLGVVVDEYGGGAGIVTLEDVMEEVLGDMTDEFDEHEAADYIKINDHNYIFEGKTMLNDVCKIIGVETAEFDKVRGDADSLAGIVLELVGQIPKIDQEMDFERFKFKIISASKKRVEKIKITIEDIIDEED